MAFTSKNWEDAPSTATPLSAAALEDLETRLSAYTDAAGGSALLGVDPTLPAYAADKAGGVDATTALRAARAAALALNMPVILPPGTYTVSGRIHDSGVTANPVRFVAAIPGTVTIQRTADVPIIDVAGSRGTSVALSANTAAGAVSVTTATLPSGLAVNDYAEVESDTIFSGIGNTAEIVKVKAITGGGPYTISFYGALEEPYLTAANAHIRKMNFAGPSQLEGITFRQTAVNRDTSANALVQLTLTRGDRVKQCVFRDADSPGLEPVSSIDWLYEDCHFENLTDDLPNDRIGYGINCGDNCLGGEIARCTAQKVRHAFTTNGNSVTPHGVPRHITVHFRSVSQSVGGALDTHPEGKHITFVNPHVYDCDGHGIFIRSPYTTVLHPTVAGGAAMLGGVTFTATASHSRLVGGDLTQAGAYILIVIQGTHVTLSGTKLTATAGGSTNLIDVSGDDSRIINLESDLGANTGSHIFYSTATLRAVLSGGVFKAATERSIANISGGFVTILERPVRFPNSGGQLNLSGAGAKQTVYGDQTHGVISTDVDVTLYWMLAAASIRHTATLTADRTLTLDTVSAPKGSRYRITRSGGGAFNLNVGAIKALATDQWCDVEFDGTAWFLSAYGDTVPVDNSMSIANGSTFKLENINRLLAATSATLVNGQAEFVYFTAWESGTITKLGLSTRGTAQVGATLMRLGLYTVAGNGDITLVARTANDTTILGTAFLPYEKALDAAGGYVTSYTIVKGVKYAIGVIQVGASTAAAAYAASIPGTNDEPIMARRLTGQTDLPASVTNASLTANGNVIWAKAAA